MIGWCRSCNKNTVSRPGKPCAACWLDGMHYFDLPEEFNTVDLRALRQERQTRLAG